MLALLAFAANSLLCRAALRSQAIEPVTFSAIRLAAGASTLGALVAWRGRRGPEPVSGSWRSAGLLALYAIPFSLAYVSLQAGTGALLLFAAVQITMIVVSIASGAKPRPLQCVGLITASGGVIYLVLPGVAAPRAASAALMILAGASWGLYTLRGRGSVDPLGQTAGNFLRAVPLALIAGLVIRPSAWPRWDGVLWAVLSGALASGIGYAVWYAALRDLSAVIAAVVQLAVPILTAAAGVVLLDEPLTVRLVAASALVLGGIGLTMTRIRRVA
jgi:drug/metabolite transporter (DMT)-like permease